MPGLERQLPGCSSDRHSPSMWVAQRKRTRKPISTLRGQNQSSVQAPLPPLEMLTTPVANAAVVIFHSHPSPQLQPEQPLCYQHSTVAQMPSAQTLPLHLTPAPVPRQTEGGREGTLRTRIKPPSHFELPEQFHQRRLAVRPSRASSFERLPESRFGHSSNPPRWRT